MTLRVTLEIVPFGIEANKRTLYQFDISNTGTATKSGKTRYEYHQMLPDTPWNETGKLIHHRSNGALSLARKLLERYEPSGIGGNSLNS